RGARHRGPVRRLDLHALGGADRRPAAGRDPDRLVLAQTRRGGGGIVSAPPERLDVSGLPEYAFGHRSRLWWGTAGFIAIEGMAFALALFAYFYLRSKLPDWPPGAAPPDLLWGTLNTLVLLASAVPNQWTKKAAEEQQLGRVRLWLVVCL